MFLKAQPQETIEVESFELQQPSRPGWAIWPTWISNVPPNDGTYQTRMDFWAIFLCTWEDQVGPKGP